MALRLGLGKRQMLAKVSRGSMEAIREAADIANPPLPLVSVVIPTHRRPALLRRCLRALLGQTYPRARFEVVVVEDGGPHGAQDVIADLAATAAPVHVRAVAVTQGGPAAARNHGWRAAHGDIIAFTDDDTVPHPRWLAEGVRALAQDADAVAGLTVVPMARRPTDWERNVGRLQTARFVTANAFCRRAALESVGGFDPRFKVAYREDSDLEFCLLETGARIVQNQAAIVYHPPRAGAPLVSLKLQRNQFFDALLYRKHPHLFRRFIRKRPPFRYYAITGSMLVAGVAALLGRWQLAASTGGLWLTQVGWFCGQRLAGTRLTPGQLADMLLTSVLIPPVALYWRLRGAWAFRVLFL